MQHKFMEEAIRLSHEGMGLEQGGPFGAVIVKNNNIIGRGYNCVLATNDPTAHAEVTAIRNACKNENSFWLVDCEIYTSCEPCPMCLSAIYWARIKTIYFGATRQDAAEIGFDDEFFYDELSKNSDNRIIKMKPFMREESLKSFATWKNKQDKTSY